MQTDVVIVGAGAAGLMAARELAKEGKKVVILEARDRIGGRIYPLDEEKFGYPAQGGAEFVHGDAPVTKALMREAGLTYVPEEGEIWSARNGALTQHADFIQNNERFTTLLGELEADISIADFLDTHFSGDEHAAFRNSVLRSVKGYEAADPYRISTTTLRDEWLSKERSSDGRIKEGYQALLHFLIAECEKYGVRIQLETRAVCVDFSGELIATATEAGTAFQSQQIIVTVPLPVLGDIKFTPEIPTKRQAASQIGFGNVVKVVIRFTYRFWEKVGDTDLSKMSFLLCNERFITWWTQYPDTSPILVGWLAGPEAAEYKNTPEHELLDMALASLATVLHLDIGMLQQEVLASAVVNWPADPFVQGAYSYTTTQTKNAYEELADPIQDKVYFAGEAAIAGPSGATVEAALASGLETANKILGA